MRQALFLLLFTLCVLLPSRVLGARWAKDSADRILSTLTWGSALVLAYVTLLSRFRALDSTSLLVVALPGGVLGFYLLLRRESERAGKNHGPGSGLPPLMAAVPAGLYAAAATAMMVAAPEIGLDNLAYHLPRLGYWIQRRAVEAFIANDPRIGSFPPNGNVLQLIPALFLRTDRLCGMVQVGALLASCLAIFATARRLGATVAAASFAVLAWQTVPSLAAQASLSMVDVIASCYLVIALYFLARAQASAFHLATSLVALQLAVGTKQHLVVFVVFMAAIAMVALYRWHRSHALVCVMTVAGTCLPLGGVFALENWRVWGSPGGPSSIGFLVVDPSASNLIRNLRLLAVPIASLFPGPTDSAYSGVREAFIEEGLGLFWVATLIVSLSLVGWDSLRRQRVVSREWVALAGGAATCGLATLYLLRHQHAVFRFSLPLACVLSVLAAWTFDRVTTDRDWAKGVLLSSAWVVAIAILGTHSWRQWQARHIGNAWIQDRQRYGPDLEPFASELQRRSHLRPVKIGVLTGQYFPEGLFFGDEYANVVVPMSYEVPFIISDLQTIGLDALWVSTALQCHIDLYHRDFTRPRLVRTSGWRAELRSFDRDFVRAIDAAAYGVYVGTVVDDLAQHYPEWGIVTRTSRGGLFVRGEGLPFTRLELCHPPTR